MPFAIKDVLHYKRNDRQKREIHEKEYSQYLTNLRLQQQQQNSHYLNMYYLSSDHINEVERSRVRSAHVKQTETDRIKRENHVLYDRLVKASKRPTVDDKNRAYQQNLDVFNSKRYQQRFNQYKRIDNENQVLLQRINNVRGQLINKQQCDHEWRKHINVMKKTCDYPENIERFVSKVNQNEQQQTCRFSKIRSAQWNNRHYITEPSPQLTITPLAILLDES